MQKIDQFMETIIANLLDHILSSFSLQVKAFDNTLFHP